MKVPVSERAAIARIRRKMKHEGLALVAGREGSRSYSDTGDWYVVNSNMNIIVAQHCSIEGLAADYEVLKAYETLAQEE